MNMFNENSCEKCQSKMIKDNLFPAKSLDTFSGTQNMTDSSACTIVTTSTSIPSTWSGYKYEGRRNQRATIKISTHAQNVSGKLKLGNENICPTKF